MPKLILAVCLLGVLARHAAGAQIHVDAWATTGGDGSAAAPFRSLPDAIAIARAGDEVLVAAGIYSNPMPLVVNGFARRALVVLPDAVTLRGSGRDTTILRGRRIDDVFYGISTEGVGRSTTVEDLRVDGFLVQGMSMRSASPTVRRVDFRNEVTGGSSVAVDVRDGGFPLMEDGIYDGGHSSLFIEFGSGGTYRRLTLGARVNESLAILGSDPILEDCIINSGGRDTIVLTTGSNPRLRRCFIDKGARWTVRVCCYPTSTVVDLSGNRWYSNDASVLQNDILDSRDDGSVNARVEVTPFEPQVERPTESFGAFRARY